MAKRLIITILFIVFVCSVGAFFYVCRSYGGTNEKRIYIPHTADASGVRDTLVSNLGESYGGRVFSLWKILSGNLSDAGGSYVVAPGEKAVMVANRIAKGRQTPIKITVNVARTEKELLNSIASKLEASSTELASALASALAERPEFRDKPSYTAAILPDTYEFYWNENADRVMRRLVDSRDRFWNDERKQKAGRLGLTPVEVTTLASIVEEESNKKDEQPVIARLYLNRLARGMRLQADPTVKFALGDFSLRRITGRHLEIDSPFNTYRHDGLPPGPIRVPQKSTIDAVLDAPAHDYIYMCAKEDFSGYHNFASDYQTHLRNARRYADELNRRGIH